MFGLSTGHLLIVLLVVLMFGRGRLPEIGKALGKGIRTFKDGLEGKSADEEDPRLK
jgi:sec-independent protein translocase protein TatA